MKSGFGILAQIAASLLVLIAILIWIGLSYVYGGHRTQREFRRTARSTLEPAEMYAWAESLKTNEAVQRDGLIDEGLLPASVTTEWPGAMKAHFGLFGKTSNTVFVVWGGGFGHWGIAIGDLEEELVSAPKSELWTSNVCFWVEEEQ